MRCFIGIPLPSATRAALVAAGESVRAADPHWRGEKWVAGENLHITLAFLGDLPSESMPQVAKDVGDRLAGTRAFQLPFAELRPIPNARRASMLWAAYLDPTGECAVLAAGVDRAIPRPDAGADDRSFTPHVTLVRARRARRAGEAVSSALLAARPTIPGFVSVASATLFSSTLTKAGPRYEALATWELAG